MTISSETIFSFPVRSIKLWESGELQLGDFGFAVQKLQQLLIQLDFYDGPIDGYLSPETEFSLRSAQSYFCLSSTGCCDCQTWQILREKSVRHRKSLIRA